MESSTVPAKRSEICLLLWLAFFMPWQILLLEQCQFTCTGIERSAFSMQQSQMRLSGCRNQLHMLHWQHRACNNRVPCCTAESAMTDFIYILFCQQAPAHVFAPVNTCCWCAEKDRRDLWPEHACRRPGGRQISPFSKLKRIAILFPFLGFMVPWG